MRIRVKIVFLLAACIASGPALLEGASSTVAAASCSTAHIQAAINAAPDGAVVTVPAGSCTWTTTIKVVSKTVTLRGAGVGATIITINGPSYAVNLDTTSSRLTGFEFRLVAGDQIVLARGQAFRVDNNKFDNLTGSSRVAVYVTGGSGVPHPRGVVDSNEFRNSRVLVYGHLALMAHEVWRAPTGLGTDNAVFIEANVFHREITGNSVDANYGGRYVFRYNTVTGRTGVEAHSVQGTHRAARSWEVYGNTFETPSSYFTAMFLRGGTGVIFDNRIAGPYGAAIWFDNRRSFDAVGDAGLCDGSSPWDANATSGGWACRDQIGRGQDGWLWTLDKPYPLQSSEPVYVWGNTLNGAAAAPLVVNDSGNHIKAGRDYYVGTPKPGYTPFTYPHPLRGASPSSLAAPKNVRIVPD